ncbi:MAG: GIY-YIG nuclease family protein [Deltaproteobacteria bacterium]
MSDDGLEWYVYLLECADATLYCGVAKDVDRRIGEHNAGKGAKYTRGRAPVKLVASAGPMRWGDALRMERAVKKLDRQDKAAAFETG